jgi:hypothetical protein
MGDITTIALSTLGFDLSKLATIIGAIFALIISGSIMSYIMNIRMKMRTKITSDLIYFLVGMNLISVVITGVAVQQILNITSAYLTIVFVTFVLAAILMWAKSFRALMVFFALKAQ